MEYNFINFDNFLNYTSNISISDLQDKEVIVESDNNEETIESTYKKELEQDSVMDQIDKLYENVIENFYNRNFPVYDSFIFSNLTKNAFMKWIINNNTNLIKLFDVNINNE